MIITPLKTQKVTLKDEGKLLNILFDALPANVPEKSILAISSKVISLCEGNVAPLSADKEALLQQESDYFLPKEFRQHNSCTITHHAFIGSAGIDESNADGQHVLLPKNAQKSAENIRAALEKKFGLKEIGVIITDSHSTPMRRGASGIAIAYAGFKALCDYRGRPDLFGRILQLEQANQLDPLAAAAVVTMGEGNEQTPLALITDIPFITFDTKAPTEAELKEFFVTLDNDVFFPIFDTTKLVPGGKRKEESGQNH